MFFWRADFAAMFARSRIRALVPNKIFACVLQLLSAAKSAFFPDFDSLIVSRTLTEDVCSESKEILLEMEKLYKAKP